MKKVLYAVLFALVMAVVVVAARGAGQAIGGAQVVEKVKVDTQEFLARPHELIAVARDAKVEAEEAVKASDDARAAAQAARDRAAQAWFWARPSLNREANRLTEVANAKTAEARQEVVMSAITTTTASSELGRWETQAIWLGISFIAAFAVVFGILLKITVELARWIYLRLAAHTAADIPEPVTPPTE